MTKSFERPLTAPKARLNKVLFKQMNPSFNYTPLMQLHCRAKKSFQLFFRRIIQMNELYCTFFFFILLPQVFQKPLNS